MHEFLISIVILNGICIFHSIKAMKTWIHSPIKPILLTNYELVRFHIYILFRFCSAFSLKYEEEQCMSYMCRVIRQLIHWSKK